MKKFVISILAIILIVTATASVGVLSAEESDVYYQIKDDVVLFDGNDTDMTVVLPAGYWLKKESVDPPNTDNDNNNNNGGGTIGPDESKGDKLPTNNVVKIVLIVAICLLAVILVFLIFKPTRTKKNGRYRIDDDDRDDAYIDDRY